jgi:hydrogenase maturation factor
VQGLAGEHLLVAAQPIVFANGKLVLGSAELRSVVRQIEGRGFVDEVSVGDWVSLHWGWACDRLTERQLRHLRQQTLYHLELANQTL